ncbi:unnamed protein product, partial [Didymodactylos carnosus]
MGSPLAPIMANRFMNELENEIEKYRSNKPDIYLRYVDDIFVIIHGTQKDIFNFVKWMNKLDPSIKFTVEVQSDNKL